MSDLARDLWDARRLGTVIGTDRDDLPTSIDDARRIQDEVLSISGLSTCGFKVGSTSEEAQRHLNTTEPAASALLAPYVYESPAEVPVAVDHMPAVEGEFAFRMGADLPPRSEPYARNDVISAIDGVAGAIEVVGTRFAGGLAGKGRLLTTADCGVNIALVLGPWHDFTDQDLTGHRVSVNINGEAKGNGTGARALGDPLNVMVWLANHLSGRGRGLKAGHVVATGTCTGLDLVKPEDTVNADFGHFGTVAITFRTFVS